MFLPYAAASVIVILLGLNLFYLSNKPIINEEPKQERILLSSIPVEFKHVLFTNNGVKGYVKLPDGSTVWLNSASRIEYPDKFLGSTREIDISGEAFFDVVSNPNKPMIVSTNKNFKVEVLGTKFNIRSYENDTEAQTTLFSGSIKLTRRLPSSGREVTTLLRPKESFVLRDYMAPVLIKQSDTSKQVAWKEGKLLFDSTPMLEVIKKLERWHGTEFIVKDQEVLDYKITANFRSESIVQIMEMIQFCSLINYKVVGNQVTISKRQSILKSI
jgi:ferric-dicitrate binding protein FerR (iron transport regulator)